jgi:tRNA(Ile)-lysidine synthase
MLPAELGRLSAEPAAAGLAIDKLPATLMVRWRRGGERLQPVGHAHHRELKKLLGEAGVLPWWRERVPLFYAGEKLLAVGDLWVAHEHAAAPGDSAIGIYWRGRPHILAASPDRGDA